MITKTRYTKNINTKYKQYFIKPGFKKQNGSGTPSSDLINLHLIIVSKNFNSKKTFSF